MNHLDLSTGLWAMPGYCLSCLVMTKEQACFECGAPVSPERPSDWPVFLQRSERVPEQFQRPREPRWVEAGGVT